MVSGFIPAGQSVIIMTTKPRSKAMKGISRIDSGSTHGWFVRAYRNAKAYSKLFSDRKCGSKAKALKLAKAHRAELNEKVEAIPKKPRADGLSHLTPATRQGKLVFP